jgi:hypothetical protein
MREPVRVLFFVSVDGGALAIPKSRIFTTSFRPSRARKRLAGLRSR